MKKILLLLIFSTFLVSSLASEAFAVEWVNWVQNRNLDQLGHASSPHIKNRHASPWEAYYIEMLDNNYSNEGLQWMIFENGSGGNFDLKWKVVDYGQPPKTIRERTYSQNISTPDWHRVKMEWISGSTWRLYFDYTEITNVSWRDRYGNLGSTQIKILSYNDPHFFMGRHYNIWFKQLGYGWRRQDDENVNWIAWGNYPSGNPYDNFPIWYDGTRQYWDWEARK